MRRPGHAADQPTREEVEADRMKHLGIEGCSEDGCYVTDPDVLDEYPFYYPSCSAVQQPPMGVRVWCDDHAPEKDPHERWLDTQRARLENPEVVAVVLFDCGRAFPLTEPERSNDPDDPNFVHPQSPEARRGPKIHTSCECGSRISRVMYPDEEGKVMYEW